MKKLIYGVGLMPLSWIEQMVRQWLANHKAEEIRQNQAKIRALASDDE